MADSDDEFPPPELVIESITLYGRSHSDCTRRLRMALNLKGVIYEYRSVEGNERASSLVQDKNPNLTVPVLEVVVGEEDLTNPNTMAPFPQTTYSITQSLAALEFLEEFYPTPALLPPHPCRRVAVRTLLSIIAADTHPLTTARTSRRIQAQFPGADEAAATGNRLWDHYWLERGMDVYEAEAERTAGRYSVGDEVTLADVCVLPAIWTAEASGVDVAGGKYPVLMRIRENLMQIDALRAVE